MADNALNSQSGRKRGTRVLTWSCLALIPALAILALGTGILPALTVGDVSGVPSGLQIADTRDFSVQGDEVALAPGAASTDSVNEFMSSWQNTVRRKPSPRR